jgi:hypothetical protein
MDEIGIEIERQEPQYYEREEGDNIVFSANSGVFQGSISIMGIWFDWRIGKALSAFPRKLPDEYSYEIGSNKPDNKSPYFSLRAYTRDNLGHTALQVTMNNKKDSPEDGECCFSIVAERSAINRLGKLISEFSNEKYRLLKWSPKPDNDALVEWEHPKLKPQKPKEEEPPLTFGSGV